MSVLKAIENAEKRLKLLKADMADIHARNQQWADHYLDLIEAIPGGLPDGTGVFAPEGWIEWAKNQLGYNEGNND